MRDGEAVDRGLSYRRTTRAVELYDTAYRIGTQGRQADDLQSPLPGP
jgi:hypothetical protein